MFKGIGMKKAGIYFVAIFFMFIVFLSGCGESVMELCFKEVSETRENFYFVRNNDFVASFTTGKRESDYQMNGEHTENIEYGVLVVDFVDKNFTDLPKFIIKIDEKEYDGTMEFNPFNNTFCVDIGKEVKGGEKIEISFPEMFLKDTLIYVSDMWQIDSKTAIEIAIKCFRKKIDSLIVDNKFQGEIFEKLLTMNKKSVEDMFWHICIFAKSGEILTCTIDVITGQIVAV